MKLRFPSDEYEQKRDSFAIQAFIMELQYILTGKISPAYKFAEQRCTQYPGCPYLGKVHSHVHRGCEFCGMAFPLSRHSGKVVNQYTDVHIRACRNKHNNKSVVKPAERLFATVANFGVPWVNPKAHSSFAKLKTYAEYDFKIYYDDAGTTIEELEDDEPTSTKDDVDDQPPPKKLRMHPMFTRK